MDGCLFIYLFYGNVFRCDGNVCRRDGEGFDTSDGDVIIKICSYGDFGEIGTSDDEDGLMGIFPYDDADTVYSPMYGLTFSGSLGTFGAMV